MISRNARAQEQFIADLLNLTQLDSGKTPLRLAVMDVVSIVEQVVDEIRAVSANANISITTELDRPIMVRGDAQRLWQIFWNLLRTPPGSLHRTAKSTYGRLSRKASPKYA